MLEGICAPGSEHFWQPGYTWSGWFLKHSLVHSPTVWSNEALKRPPLTLPQFNLKVWHLVYGGLRPLTVSAAYKQIKISNFVNKNNVLFSNTKFPLLKIKPLSIRWVDGLHGPGLLFADIMSHHVSVCGLFWSTGYYPGNPDLFHSEHPAVLLPACPIPGGPGQHPRHPWPQPLR